MLHNPAAKLKNFVKYFIITKTNNGENVNVLTLCGHILLTSTLITIVIGGHFITYSLMRSWQDDWLTCDIEKVPFFIEAKIDKKPKSRQQPEPIQVISSSLTPEKRRLNQQLQSIQELTTKNCNIMAFFYKEYFISLSISNISAILTIVCIFFLSKEGWEKSNNALINLSVTAFVVTTFYIHLTQVFQQDQNLRNSQDLYANYSALLNDFTSSLVLIQPTAASSGSSKSIANTSKPSAYSVLIRDTDKTLNKLGYIHLGFDPHPIIEIQNRANSIFVGNK